MEGKRIRDRDSTIFLYLIVSHFILFQLLSILRGAAILNTAYLALYFSLAISLFMVFVFIVKIKRIKYTLFETVFLLIPLVYFLFGLIINGFNRDLFSDTYNATFFAILLIYTRNLNVNFDFKLQSKFANWMLVALFLSTIFYLIAPMIGIRVYSVGATSIYFVFPLIVFLINKKYTKFLITLVLLILASKRGVLLSVLSVFLILAFGSRNIKPFSRIIIIFGLIITVSGTLYTTSSPYNISKAPEQIQPLFYKTMYINPLSEYNRLDDDARVREVIYSMKPLIEEPGFLLTGKGPGNSYEYFDVNGNLINESHHNTHFSPVSIFSKYGFIYTFILYCFIGIVLFKNYKLLKRKQLSIEHTILYLYVVAGFINTFTAYTMYLDYLFIVSLGILSSNIYSKHPVKEV